MEIQEKIKQTYSKQNEFYYTHKTRDINFRLESLKKLRVSILKYEDKLYEAFFKDLHKSETEVYGTEIGLVLSEISLHIKKLNKWAKPRRVPTGLLNFKSTSFIYPEPFGHVLIVSPWNYPFLLLFQPLVSAIAAGNVITMKTSPYVPEVGKIMEEIIRDAFDENYISFYNGGRVVNQALLEYKYDYAFFTGSPFLGQIVMEKASKYMTPLTLELGGKSPTIVDKDANINIAAKRIAWGKFINAGQTCVAPDYLFIHKDIKEKFLAKFVEYVEQYYGTNAQESPDYPRIVNKANVERLRELISSGNLYYGGKIDIDDRYIQPTVITEVAGDAPVMQQEIFGPILPVMEFQEIDEVINYVNTHPKPLAFYYFGESKKQQNYVLTRTSSGGGCVNDTLMHLSNHHLPFGGVGNSGMGRYHGKYGYDTFSNLRAILNKATWIDVPVRYAPFKPITKKLFKLFLH